MNDSDTRGLIGNLNQFFETTVEMLRIRVGKRQTIETMINEDALLLVAHPRDECETWTPRLAAP